MKHLIISLLLFVTVSYATIINVPADYATIQAGIDGAIDGDTVLVAAGTYVENINYNGKDIVVGSLYLTTQDTSYISLTVIDGNQNGSVVTFENSEDSTAVLTGFTITNGSSDYGGGIFCSWSHSRIVNCIIISNSAVRGGGISCDNSSPIIENCSISNNSASYGGGIYCYYSSPRISYSIMSNNSTGAVLLYTSSPEISFCRITNNMGGPGITIHAQSSPIISNSLISDNSGDGCRFTNGSYPDFINCLISNNSGDGLWSSSAGADITNCTIAYNAGDGVYTQASSVFIHNSILYGNNEFQIYVWSPPLPQISYSDVEDKNSGGVHGGVDWGQGNIDADPFFCEPGLGDYTLAANSPCVGSGENLANMGAFDVGCGPLSLSGEIVIPTGFVLHQNYPNPFNPITTLRYDLPENSYVNVTVYDMLGREVRTLVNTTQDAGFKSVIWDATNEYGNPVSAGVYLYKIQAGEFVQTKKMVLLK